MVTINQVLSYSLDKFKRRIIKTLRFGRVDGKESFEISPFGLDSGVPIGCKAVYCKSHNRGVDVIIGYINQNQLAEIGETRIYSAGTQIWLRKNGTIEIGGDSDFLTKHSELQETLNNLATNINAQLSLIATGIATGGGAYTPTNISIDINSAKTENIKV